MKKNDRVKTPEGLGTVRVNIFSVESHLPWKVCVALDNGKMEEFYKREVELID